MGILHEDLRTFILLTAVRYILQLDNSAKANHFCTSMATLNYLVLLPVTLRPTAIKKGSIESLLRQQLLSKTATLLRYTYITFVFLF
jgi:hypothetical protein